MQISEPVTMLTDYALAVASFVFALLTFRLIGPRTRVTAWLWSAAFAASGVAAVVGGTYHGFARYFEAGTLRTSMNVVIFLMGMCAAFVTAGMHSAQIQRKNGTVKWLVYAILVTLAGAIVQQSGFRRGVNFNHNDFYHLIQIVGLYFLFRCAKTVRDRSGIPI